MQKTAFRWCVWPVMVGSIIDGKNTANSLPKSSISVMKVSVAFKWISKQCQILEKEQPSPEKQFAGKKKKHLDDVTSHSSERLLHHYIP